MIACCACRITPNELATASVATQLASNPLTSVVPTGGVIKIVNGTPPAGGCNPAAFTVGAAPAATIVGYATHLQSTGGATYVTETRLAGLFAVGVAALGTGKPRGSPSRCIRGRGPDVPLGVDLSIDIEVVEQPEAPRQFVMVRRDLNVEKKNDPPPCQNLPSPPDV